MWLKWFAILVCLGLQPSLAAADQPQDLESELRRDFETKVLTLRAPYSATILKFDPQGNLAGASDVGRWTVDAVLRVTHLWLQGNSLEIEGNRILITLGLDKNSPVVPIETGQTIHVTLDLIPPLSTALDVEKAMTRIFTPEAVQVHFNEYWKPSPEFDAKIEPRHKRDPDAVAGTLSQNPVFFVSNHVIPPKPISTPDPSYPDSARKRHLQGTVLLMVVINQLGKPEILKLSRSLEPSLDIMALIAVSTWTFQPAIKDGKPVAVVVNIEVSFNLG